MLDVSGGEEALAIGPYVAPVARSLQACSELAANHHWDSDSTVSIAGQPWGARFGLVGMPREAVDRVDVLASLVAVRRAWEERYAIASPFDLTSGSSWESQRDRDRPSRADDGVTV